MKKYLPRIFFTSFTLLSFQVAAGGFQLYEVGTPIVGTACVGQAVVSDASTSYFNPAGMTQLDETEFELTGQTIGSTINFTPDAENSFAGTATGNAGELAPGVGFFAVYNKSENFKLGLSFATPFAGAVTYNNGWPGRFFVQNATILTLDGNLAAAYRLNECFSFGFGVFLEYAKLQEQIAIPTSNPAVEGEAALHLHSYRPGFTLGFLFTPCEDTKIGISYRSSVRHRPRGHITFLRLTQSPVVTSKLNLPQSVIASLSQECTEKFTFLAEVGWSNWSTFQNTNINLSNVTLPILRNWRDTYRLGLGGQYKIFPTLVFQGGVSYDSSPCGPTTRLPDLPVDRQVRAGLGIVYTTPEQVNLGLQYEYINFGKAPIHNSTRLGMLSGHYSKNYANVIALSMNCKF